MKIVDEADQEAPDLDEKLENPDLREYIEQLQSTILPPIEFDDM